MFFGNNIALRTAKTDTQFAANGRAPRRFEALATKKNWNVTVRDTGTLRACGHRSSSLGVSGFLLPTFLSHAPGRKSPCGTKKSRCRPAQGQRPQTQSASRMPTPTGHGPKHPTPIETPAVCPQNARFIIVARASLKYSQPDRVETRAATRALQPPAKHQGRTTWKPNLPAARANGFSNSR